MSNKEFYIKILKIIEKNFLISKDITGCIGDDNIIFTSEVFKYLNINEIEKIKDKVYRNIKFKENETMFSKIIEKDEISYIYKKEMTVKKIENCKSRTDFAMNLLYSIFRDFGFDYVEGVKEDNLQTIIDNFIEELEFKNEYNKKYDIGSIMQKETIIDKIETFIKKMNTKVDLIYSVNSPKRPKNKI